MCDKMAIKLEKCQKKRLLKISVGGTVSYIMTVHKSPNFDGERHFCTEFGKFRLEENFLSKDL